MKRMILFFSHQLTETQREEARAELGVKKFLSLPENLQEKWSQIEPFPDKIPMDAFFSYLQENSQKGDVILIQGDYGATCALVAYAKQIGCIPVYATAVRGNSIAGEKDPELKEGSFKHCRFRRY